MRHAMIFNDIKQEPINGLLYKDIIIECFYLKVVSKSIVFLRGTLKETLAA